MTFLPYLKLSRPKQWSKNLFVFAALFFSHQLMNSHAILESLLAFATFCLASSAVYVLNDIIDVEKDRQHPKKRNRPIAAGVIKIPSAIVYGIMLLLVAFVVGWLLNWIVLLIVIAYFLMNILYSFWLKHIVLIDVFVIAFGFVLRVLVGSYALPVQPSPWLLLCTLLLALFLGLCKRRSELLVLQTSAGSHRKILLDYDDDKLIDQLIAVLSATTIMAYSLYAFSGTNGHGTLMMLTIPFVIYALFRYLFLVYKKESGGEPANVLLGDKPFLISCLLWAIVSFVILYFF